MDQDLRSTAAFFWAPTPPLTLGDKLHLLARLSPSDVLGIALIVEDALQRRLRLVSERHVDTEP